MPLDISSCFFVFILHGLPAILSQHSSDIINTLSVAGPAIRASCHLIYSGGIVVNGVKREKGIGYADII